MELVGLLPSNTCGRQTSELLTQAGSALPTSCTEHSHNHSLRLPHREAASPQHTALHSLHQICCMILSTAGAVTLVHTNLFSRCVDNLQLSSSVRLHTSVKFIYCTLNTIYPYVRQHTTNSCDHAWKEPFQLTPDPGQPRKGSNTEDPYHRGNQAQGLSNCSLNQSSLVRTYTEYENTEDLHHHGKPAELCAPPLGAHLVRENEVQFGTTHTLLLQLCSGLFTGFTFHQGFSLGQVVGEEDLGMGGREEGGGRGTEGERGGRGRGEGGRGRRKGDGGGEGREGEGGGEGRGEGEGREGERGG